MVIALSGAPRVGKDTFANFFINNNNVVSYAFAKPIKEMLCAAFGWSMDIFESDLKDVKDFFWHVSPREAMEYIGTEIMRCDIRNRFPEFDKFIGEKIWVKRFEKFYLENQNKTIIITDLRYDPEFEFLKTIGSTNIKIERTNIDIDTKRMYCINKYKFDYELVNDSSLDNYKEKCKQLFNKIIKENK